MGASGLLSAGRLSARTTIAPAYARYVLGLLFVAYVFNFVDRQILAILLQPIKEELLADYFPAERRATAMAVFSMGVHVGLAFGFLLGGWIAQFFGWRAVFFAVGLLRHAPSAPT